MLIACEGLSAFEIESNEERMSRQSELLKKLDSRAQVSSLKLHSDFFTISFISGETYKFSNEGTPIFYIGDNNCWFVNGIDSRRKVQSKDNRIQIPYISRDDNWNWVIDGIATDVAANTVLSQEDLENSYISYIVLAEDWIHVYLYNGDPIHVPVVTDSFYKVPSYFLDSLIKKERKAESFIESAGDACASFVFLTDTHWGKNMQHSPSLIRHIIDYTPLDDVIFGGDVVTSHSSNLVTPMETGKDFQKSFSFLGTRFHCLYGNHDNNSDQQRSKTEYHLSDEQVFSFLQSQMTDVTFGGYFNFYYDNPVTKTRIIGLDTGRFNYTAYRDKLPATVQFTVDALNSLPPDWHAIMASHIWCKATRQSDGSYKYSIDSIIKPILKVFDDYNNRLSGKYSYSGSIIQYDFADALGRVEFCIGGHIHNNYLCYSDGGIPVVSIFPDYLINSEARGTYFEQSVTIVVTDYQSRKLHLIVVGKGEDRHIDLLDLNP